MSHSCEYFQSEAIARKLSSLWSKHPGCRADPFFMVPLDVILDELHLMLRITDRLEEGLILDIMKWNSVSR